MDHLGFVQIADFDWCHGDIINGKRLKLTLCTHVNGISLYINCLCVCVCVCVFVCGWVCSCQSTFVAVAATFTLGEFEMCNFAV